ncbi:MAG: hypothetical protein ACKVH8_15285 [Pirellulales bacterium]
MSRSTTLFAGLLFTAFLAAPQLASAGHFTHQHRLEDDIEALHQASERLHDILHHRAGFSHLDDEAQKMAEAAEHFCDTAQQHGSLSHLRADFNEVMTEFRHVQSELRQAHYAHHSYTVQRAWVDVERAMDRVYYDLYETHCRYVRYRCSIQISHGHNHYNNHHNGGHYNSGPVQIHYQSKAPAWAHILNAALNH